MGKTEIFFDIILGISCIWSLISANFTGILYDDQKQKLDHSYKGNHSFFSSSFNRYRFNFSIPFPIENNKFKEELKIITNKYNRAAYTFWISLILLFVINYCK